MKEFLNTRYFGFVVFKGGKIQTANSSKVCFLEQNMKSAFQSTCLSQKNKEVRAKPATSCWFSGQQWYRAFSHLDVFMGTTKLEN